MEVRLQLRASGQRAQPGADPSGGEHRLDGVGPEEFARWADPGGEKLLVVLVDNAGWHVAKRLPIPPGVVLHRLPPCTPELQPTEPLWPLVRKSVANEGFEDLGEMEPVLVERCRWLIDHLEAVRGAVGFGWAVALNG